MSLSFDKENQIQEPLAIVGFACRLPGGNTSPHRLWEFLEQGGIASNKVPESRFNLHGHWDGSQKPRTMRPLGGMFLEHIDPADFDAPFFEISRTEAISMDPNQRQMLEVVFEGLENAGVTMQSLDGTSVGCFVGSYASDYHDMQARDPEDRPASITVGSGRAILANRLSHFLNIKGPSMTIDTACSGSLVGIDVARRYLQSGEIDAAIIAASNLYLNPEHVMDTGAVGNAHSPTGICHTFDASADGYVKAEAVSMVMIKRLSDAVKNRDPIRAVLRGSATNSDGRTPGIASPSAEAQAVAIRSAYSNAGITDLGDTTYLECHGTGTQAGDPMEVGGAGSVFATSRKADMPLIIGSIKSNLGHAEPAAGISGLMKAVMAIEKGIIPGNPTFETPNPKIDFAGLKVMASKHSIPWPQCLVKRASINSFGYGGSNAHIILEEAKIPQGPAHVSSYMGDDDEISIDDDEEGRYFSLVVSANDEVSLRANIDALCTHMINPRVKVDLQDLAYTLSERRTHLFHGAYLTTRTIAGIKEQEFVAGKKSSEIPRIGFIFTGQGAQFPQMGKDLIQHFPQSRIVLKELDTVLQSLQDKPDWSLLDELTDTRTAKHLRQPEFSQPLVTALQICLLSILEEWGITAQSVVGHSSGEIAAAYAAGFLSRADAIRAAFYRGRAAVNAKASGAGDNVGMLAVGLSHDLLAPLLEKYKDSAWVACFNSPSSLTVSGKQSALDALKEDIQSQGHFARSLQVDLAYHSPLMQKIGEEYRQLLDNGFHPMNGRPGVSMFSSVTGSRKVDTTTAEYWLDNMVSPVRFDNALREMLSQGDRPNFLIEIGPSSALAGPVAQIKKSLPGQGQGITYYSSWSRGLAPAKAIFDVAGKLLTLGGLVDMTKVNKYDESGENFGRPHTIIDLPNYVWNHRVKYWHENQSSKDWRFKNHVNHDLLGSKILGTSWTHPTWRKLLNVADVPWLKDHKMGSDTLMPGSGYIAMAVEALFQVKHALSSEETRPASPNELCYRFRNIRFDKALVLEDGKDIVIQLSITPFTGSSEWHSFRISSFQNNIAMEHCSGSVRIQTSVAPEQADPKANVGPLYYPTSGQVWYKAQSRVGYGFGPAFQKLLKVESTSGKRQCRSLVSLAEPDSKWSQSYYPIHPACLDGCFQTVTPSIWAGERSLVNTVIVPSIIDELIINTVPSKLQKGLSIANSEYSGRGRYEETKSYFSNCSVFDPDTRNLIMQMSGLHLVKLDIGDSPDPHIFDLVSWKPDITFLAQDELSYLHTASQEEKISLFVDLVAHKKPALKVLEINLDKADLPSVWFNVGDESGRAAYSEYTFAALEAQSLISFQTKHESRRNAEFMLLNSTSEGLGLSEQVYDLVVVRLDPRAPATPLDIISAVSTRISRAGHAIFISQTPSGAQSSGAVSEDGCTNVPSASSQSSVLESTSSLDSNSPSGRSQNGTAKTEAVIEMEQVYQALEPRSQPKHLSTMRESLHKLGGFEDVLHVDVQSDLSAYFCTRAHKSESAPTNGPQKLFVARLTDSAPKLNPSLRSALEISGWSISEHDAPFKIPSHTSGTTILVLDELAAPVLRYASQAQWKSLQSLVSSDCPLLWVTKGAQYRVTEPDNALVAGLFRVIRMEDASATLFTLDVESSTSTATWRAITAVLGAMHTGRMTLDGAVETEFAERDGMLFVHRYVPDSLINDFKRDQRLGLAPVEKDLHSSTATISLRADRLGTFDGLVWCEAEDGVVAVEAGKVEVEMMAVGVNFKDVAVTMGIVPENEHTIGYEGAGVVRRLGPGVTKFKVGDRVCFLNNGSYANRLQVPTRRAHAIPVGMSFEDAATIPSVYLASWYSLFNMADIKRGQSVLIHSASGGVGISCIQLAKYVDAEVFVTVGTDEKRKFLTDTYGIADSHIFSSRNTSFAQGILRETNGRGVDIIINSLAGEMLDESWRICADGGIMVEIGKKDIVDRNVLSMEPFDRNCSFRAMDFSYTKDISDELIEGLLQQIFDLINAGKIGQVHPITVFGFDKVPSALACIRSGRHIGKVIISKADMQHTKVPVRPALRKLALRSDVSYLIVGGLKGLCGNLAVHMARYGARRIIVCSRSGLGDDVSTKATIDCKAYGCEVVEAVGDVTDASFMDSVFNAANPPIRGVIQGAMVLKDKPFETMSLDEWHSVLMSKVAGTWSLHAASLKQPSALDFFTMLSSISGIVGKKGQSNYAAANAFLDSFATYRQSLGLRANAVDLGLIEDVGYVADQGGMDTHFDKRQWTPILEPMLRNILSYSVLQQTASPISPNSTAQLLTGIGCPLPRDSDLSREARFGYLFAQGSDGLSSDGGGARGGQDDQVVRAFQLLRKSGAAPEALIKVAVDAVAAQFTKILRLETVLEPGRPLMAYGLDSLAAVELRNWVRKELGATLTTLDVTNSTSLIALCEKLVSKLG